MRNARLAAVGPPAAALLSAGCGGGEKSATETSPAPAFGGTGEKAGGRAGGAPPQPDGGAVPADVRGPEEQGLPPARRERVRRQRQGSLRRDLGQVGRARVGREARPDGGAVPAGVRRLRQE